MRCTQKFSRCVRNNSIEQNRKGIMKEFIEETKLFLSETEKKLRSISEFASSVKPAPNKWSSKEILGHLVDSSINNLTRFVNGQYQADLVFPGYDQDKWVALQNYQTAKWEFIIDMWKLNNAQLIRILELMPDQVRTKKHSLHNFDVIEWKGVPQSEPATLDYLIGDYYGHMKYHLDQILK